MNKNVTILSNRDEIINNATKINLFFFFLSSFPKHPLELTYSSLGNPYLV